MYDLRLKKDTAQFKKEVKKLVEHCGYTEEQAIQFMEGFATSFRKIILEEKYNTAMKEIK